MPKITWDAKYATHVHIIDEEHKDLFKTLNVLDGVNSNLEIGTVQKDVLLRQVLRDLQRYTETHFVVEEELMRIYEYPELGTHKEEHQKFIDMVEYLISLFDESGFDLPQTMANFLGSWLVNHIGEVDSHLGAFLVTKGQN